MKVKNNMLSCVVSFNSQNIQGPNSLFIAKKTERCFEVMKFMKSMSLVSGKLDLSQVLRPLPTNQLCHLPQFFMGIARAQLPCYPLLRDLSCDGFGPVNLFFF